MKLASSRFPVNTTISVPTQSQQTWTVSSDKDFTVAFVLTAKKNVSTKVADRFKSLTFFCNLNDSWTFEHDNETSFGILTTGVKGSVVLVTLDTVGELPKVCFVAIPFFPIYFSISGPLCSVFPDF